MRRNQVTFNRILKFLSIIFIALILLFGIKTGYSMQWTGFNETTTPNGNYIPAKNLWDWMELFIVPIVLSVGAFYLNYSERERDRQRIIEHSQIEFELKSDQQKEDALQNYIDRTSELLLKEELLTTKNKTVLDIAKVRTFSLLRRLDGKRKAIVILFLYDSGLIMGHSSIYSDDSEFISEHSRIDMADADISAIETPQYLQLSSVNFERANLVGANLKNVRFSDSILNSTNLSHSNLSGADFFHVELAHANLSKSIIMNAHFLGVDLRNTDFSFADLSMSVLRNVNLDQAKFLKSNLSETEIIGSRFRGADLRSVNLSNASLVKTDFTDATLTDANLQGADLTDAKLFGADISYSNLAGATISTKQLGEVKSLQGVIMPNGKKQVSI